MRRLLAVIGLATLNACSGVGNSHDDLPVGPDARVTFEASTGAVVLRVEVADDPGERARGLMERTHLPEDGGMVFLFDTPVRHAFVMRDTLIPLAIAFWNRDRRIVGFFEMLPCEEEPCPEYRPSRTYLGAVEANASWFGDHGVEIGDRLNVELGVYG